MPGRGSPAWRSGRINAAPDCSRWCRGGRPARHRSTTYAAVITAGRTTASRRARAGPDRSASPGSTSSRGETAVVDAAPADQVLRLIEERNRDGVIDTVSTVAVLGGIDAVVDL